MPSPGNQSRARCEFVQKAPRGIRQARPHSPTTETLANHQAQDALSPHSLEPENSLFAVQRQDPDSPDRAVGKTCASDRRRKPPLHRRFLPRWPAQLRPRRRSSSGSAPLPHLSGSPLPPSLPLRQARAKIRPVHLVETSPNQLGADPPPRATAELPLSLLTTAPDSPRKSLWLQSLRGAIPSQKIRLQNPPPPSDPNVASPASPSFPSPGPYVRSSASSTNPRVRVSRFPAG